ncbi:hypothetical protein CBP51_00115 [Cellvibrio mixtus]|uniref:Uncharacterized protein n=1 Tax=Cellvibrio mixtus TaxID=39650 RepID=A0A266Q1A7_9GAMM|nr:hypothetical protein [Cellvibrio mixtus]OZY83151.1 hypothetical protein CBP51_20405 [Cellvibrio mixtus]OZY83162.1 hypothetical protein CBP51_20460 [Cellvibrio mixtus]OZY85483.1 hypothetical protein CBP51_00060 [Cellvibrio mixtus]OZY85494.1 hypothetical protein CBP51_00115 [Cellvibrio mixtus]
MNIRKKPIESVRIREDRAVMLKEKAWELSIKVKDHVTESDLINYLIDTMTDRLDVTKEGKLVIRED